MYASFRYAVRKAATVKSTWLILAIAVALMIGLAGVLPFNINFRSYQLTGDAQYMLSMYISYAAGLGTILTLIIAVFAGFKGAAMFRDEIEDGSLLIMLSKPITRSTLIFSKWLAYITVLVVFCFLVSLAHAFGIGIGTNFEVNGLSLVKGIFLELAFALIFSLIFAGLALFFSTILTATQTAVTVLVFGVLSPLTSVIQPVTATPEYISISTAYTGQRKDSVSQFLAYRKLDTNGTTSLESTTEVLQRIANNAVFAFAETEPVERDKKIGGVFALLRTFEEFGLISGAPATVEELNVRYVFNLFTQEANLANPDLRLANFLFRELYVPSSESNLYLPLRIIDFNGQASALSDYVTDAIFSKQAVSDVATLTNGRIGQQFLRRRSDIAVTKGVIDRVFAAVSAFSEPSASERTSPAFATEEERQAELQAFFDRIGGTAYTVRYERYINKDFVLIAYVLIAVALTPVALIILRYKNIR